MERIVEEQIYKTVEVDGEQTQVLDCIMRYTYDDETITVDGEPVTQSTLTKTEKIMPDGTTYLITVHDGGISQVQTYPAVETVIEKTQLEILQETVDALVLAALEV